MEIWAKNIFYKKKMKYSNPKNSESTKLLNTWAFIPNKYFPDENHFWNSQTFNSKVNSWKKKVEKRAESFKLFGPISVGKYCPDKFKSPHMLKRRLSFSNCHWTFFKFFLTVSKMITKKSKQVLVCKHLKTVCSFSFESIPNGHGEGHWGIAGTRTARCVGGSINFGSTSKESTADNPGKKKIIWISIKRTRIFQGLTTVPWIRGGHCRTSSRQKMDGSFLFENGKFFTFFKCLS